VGISVSRVGSAAQVKAMKAAVGTLKSDLQQFRELEAFAAFGSDLDSVSKAQLERGYRLTELLKQGVGEPMPVDDQVVSLFAGTNGYLDDIDTSDVGRFEEELLEWFRTRHAGLLSEVRDTGKVDEEALESGVKAFAESFVPTGGVAGSEPDAEDQGDAELETVTSSRHLPEEEVDRDADEEESD